MTESEEKFMMVVKTSIEKVKDDYKMRISKINIEHIVEEIYKNIKAYLSSIQ